jgi:hypothetical protein
MTKKIEDIVTPERRKSIRDIPVTRKRKSINLVDMPNVRTDSVGPRAERPDIVLRTSTPTAPPPPPRPPVGRDYVTPPRPRKFPGKGFWLSIVSIIMVLIVAGMSFFSGATLSYVPRVAELSFDNDSHTAYKTVEGALRYSVVKLSGDKGVTVQASGQEQVQDKASGVIVVYNDNDTTQRLVENTRFEAANGKVYRIKSPITVPAKSTVSGQSKPGSIEVTVYADEEGESYNTGLTDFTLPGLSGTPRFSTVYARSKTDMSGGFVGMMRRVPAEELTRAKAELRSSLEMELVDQARAEVPEDFVLVPTLSSMVYEDLPQTDSANESVSVNLRGNLFAVMFKRADLARYLASDSIQLSVGEVVSLESYDNLVFTFSGEAPEDLLSSSQIDFRVSGSALLVWRPDEIILKKDLAARHKSEVQSVVNNYPSIARAEVTLRPFWKSSFPSNISDISIRKLPIR